MDVHMPEMDGLEATRRIRLMEPSRQPRIFAMTASTLDSERQQCLDAGLEQHSAKPIKKQLLAAALVGVRRRDATATPPVRSEGDADAGHAAPALDGSAPPPAANESHDPALVRALDRTSRDARPRRRGRTDRCAGRRVCAVGASPARKRAQRRCRWFETHGAYDEIEHRDARRRGAFGSAAYAEKPSPRPVCSTTPSLSTSKRSRTSTQSSSSRPAL